MGEFCLQAVEEMFGFGIDGNDEGGTVFEEGIALEELLFKRPSNVVFQLFEVLLLD